MKIGDTLTGKELSELPVGAVVVLDPAAGAEHDVLVRTPGGVMWVGVTPELANAFEHDEVLSVGGWKLVHLPRRPLKVGDVVGDRAAELPPGTVVVDDAEDEPTVRPAIKVADDVWLYWAVQSFAAGYVEDEIVDDHRILHIPDADRSAGSATA